MKKIFLLSLLVALMTSNLISRDKPLIINHEMIKLDLPTEWIMKAKAKFKISYGHTSHGSQIITGLSVIKDRFGNNFDYKIISSFGQNVSPGQLSILDYYPDGDLGNPDRTEWATKTRQMLNNPKNDRNLVMWSWCGQVDGSQSDIQTYLNLMNNLEKDFPNVTFIYMTGHLNGTGVNGNVNIRNNQIRDFCLKNNKILFDFADIESYDPDGNYFLDKDADDGCYYYDGETQKNWAEEWCEKHPSECDDCDCAHSHCLNCRQKGAAFWNMMAKLAELDEETSNHEAGINLFEFNINPNPVNDYLNISCFIQNESFLSISIIDLIGNKTSILYDEHRISGNYYFGFDVSNFPSGIYFIKFTAGSFNSVKKIIISR